MKRPGSQAPGSTDRSAGVPDPGAVTTLRSGDVEAAVAQSGRFTFGVTRDGQPIDLLFGHPNGKDGEGIWSSYVTIRVDGTNFRLDMLEGLRTITSDNGSLRMEGRVPGMQVLVGMEFHPQPADQHAFRLVLRAHNEDTVVRSIGFRILLDTWAGDNDGVPFTIPGAPSGENYIYSKEVKFNPSASSLWETYDPSAGGIVHLQSRIVGPGLNPPDQVAFANWNSAFQSEWDYPVKRDLFFTGDSAVLSWWRPIDLRPGVVRTIATEYRSVIRDRAASFELVDPQSGAGIAYLRYRNKDSALAQVEFNLSVAGGEVIHSAGSGPLRFQVEPGTEFFRAVAVSIVANGRATLVVERRVVGAIGDIGQTERQETAFLLPATDRSVLPPVWQPTRAYPIRFLADKGELALFGRLKEARTGRVLGVVRLVPRQFGKSFVYEGAVTIPTDHEGTVQVEIYSE